MTAVAVEIARHDSIGSFNSGGSTSRWWPHPFWPMRPNEKRREDSPVRALPDSPVVLDTTHDTSS